MTLPTRPPSPIERERRRLQAELTEIVQLLAEHLGPLPTDHTSRMAALRQRLAEHDAKMRTLRCGACFWPGVLVPPGQPRRAGRCRLPHGHTGDHDFPSDADRRMP